MSDGPCETPLSDHVSSALSKMASGEWFLRLTHPNPAEGSSSYGPHVAEAIAVRLAKAERALEEAEKVIAPFADQAETFDPNGNESIPDRCTPAIFGHTIGHLRAARKLKCGKSRASLE